MTWLAQLRLGPLAGGSVVLAEPFGAVALPIGVTAAGLAVYAYVRDSDQHHLPCMPAGQLRYVFECVRPYTDAERRLFGFALVETEVVAA